MENVIPADSLSPSHLPALGEGFELMQLIWELDHELQMRSRRMKAQLGLTGPQRLVVKLVGLNPGIAAGQLAKMLHLDPSTLTGILDRLVELGALERAIDPRDRRRALFTLTARGLKMKELESGTAEAAVQAALTKLQHRDLAGFRSVVGAIIESLRSP